MREPERLLQDYLRINTSNPPGEEERAANFLKDLFSQEGIPAKVYKVAPGRANLLAKLGDGNGAFLMMHHMDVVPAEGDKWELDPFSGEIIGNYIYGRGALDTKGFGIAQVCALLRIKKEGKTLKRPVWLLATCDEERGGKFGARWCLENLEDLKRVAFVLNEGGGIILNERGNVHHCEISVAQKVVAQFGLKARGEGGHGSMPHRDNACEKLVRAIGKILSYKEPPRLIELVENYFKSLAPLSEGEEKRIFSDPQKAVREQEEFFLSRLHFNALIRNTYTLTVLKAGQKVNVIPSEALAFFDARLLPDEDPKAFLERIKTLVEDPEVELFPYGEGEVSPPSPLETPLYEALCKVIRKKEGDVLIVPSLIPGATDSRFFRSKGIPCYDFSPFKLTQEEMRLIHNQNERISLENLYFAIDFLYELILEVAT